jgi:type VI protein secretion system component Hcp
MMKKIPPSVKSLLAGFIIITVFSSHAQQQFVHTATKGNNSCNGDCTTLDVAGLNNNSKAVIWVTAIIEKGLNPNPHPIGLYYFKDQWRIMNLDQKPIPLNTKFNVEYIESPDENHFQYTIAPENIQRNTVAVIDHPSLNNNPTAKFNSIMSWDPQQKHSYANRDSVAIKYNSAIGKWEISNINGKPVPPRVTYNIMFTSKGTITAPLNAIQINELIIPPTSSVVSPIGFMFITVWADRIKLPGGGMNNALAYADKTEVYQFDMSAISSGRRGYEPFVFRTLTGYPITVPMFNAFVKKQSIAVTIDVYSTTQNGTIELNYSVKLTGGTIVGFKQTFDYMKTEAGSKASAWKGLDETKITFTKIEYVKDGVSVIDNL